MKKKTAPIFPIAVLVIVVVIIGLVTNLVKKYTPASEVMDSKEYFGLKEEDEAALILHDAVSNYKGLVSGDTCYIDFEAVKEELNDRFYWDSEANLMLYTTPDDVIKISAGSKEYTMTGKTESAPYEIVRVDGTKTYLALDFVQKYTNLEYEMFKDPNRIVITSDWGEKTVASIRKKGKVRYQGGIKSPILREVEKNEIVTVLEPMEDWTGILTQDGYFGYIRNDRLEDERTETFERNFQEPEYTSVTKDYKINLVWHQIANMDSNYNIIYDIANVKGVNTISPTWFTIASNDGTLDSLALADYVETAHKNDMEVWPLVDNFSESIDTTTVLNSTASREKMENQLIAAAIQYGFDGINVDFENIPEEAADGYIQFIRELSVKCRKNGLVLSVDVPVPMPFTEHYNRKELGTVCDYVIIMGYDEHYYGSEEAGSVASLSFENQGILDTKEVVPAEKIISGIPFYTRLWNTQEQADGTKTVTSEAMGMWEAEQILQNNNVEATWDEQTSQNYAEFEGDDGSLYQIWMEDDKSIEEKVTLVKDYGLAGVAAWKLGFENDSVWDVILKYVS
ncbi:MAG: glycosyl hydrolase family 18 protein [Eubacteriales bacterium]|nr:glycosyl hydrolase family 18 protein [Eubacteriales bacterium]